MPANDKTRPGYPEDAARSASVKSLLGSMDTDAKVKQLYGIPNNPNHDYNDIERSQDVDLGGNKTLRGYRYRDAGRGVNLAAGQDNRADKGKDYSTTYPTPSIRSASWDPDLEFRVGEALGDETMGSNNNMLLAPCMNIIRHPFWGRTQETYGEDTYHTGRMASALAAGIQQHVVACAKHFAANNIEKNRINQNALMDEQTLREIYGRHFEMVVREGGVGCVMASYNMINNTKSTQNQHLLTDILRGSVDSGGFGFKGLVISDWWAMPGYQSTPGNDQAQSTASEAIKAGLDIEVPWGLNYPQLSGLASSDSAIKASIDAAASRVLEQKFRFNTVYSDSPWGLGTATTKLSGDSITNNDSHLDLAEEAERKSAVLLTNGTADAPVLPIQNVKTIAVVGLDVEVNVSSQTQPPPTGTRLKFASDVNVGDRGSSRVNPDPATSVGPFAGIQAAAVRAGMSADSVTTGTDVKAAQGADFIVVVVGLTAGDEGEEYSLDSLGDRSTLHISSDQEDFVTSVLDLNKPTAIIVESGSVVAVPWRSHSNKNQATIWAGYGGQRQGDAFGKLLFGEANFSGKMPLAWPKEEDMPAFSTGVNSTQMDYFFGYRYYDQQNKSDNLEFPFGWGMSYSKFTYSGLTPLAPPCTGSGKNNVVTYSVDVLNDSDVPGEEVVMLFVKGPTPAANITGKRPVKELKSFKKVNIAARQTETVQLQLNIQDLRHWEGDKGGHNVIDNGAYTIMVGPNAKELTQTATLNVHD
jgi:beta-glucosidase